MKQTIGPRLAYFFFALAFAFFFAAIILLPSRVERAFTKPTSCSLVLV